MKFHRFIPMDRAEMSLLLGGMAGPGIIQDASTGAVTSNAAGGGGGEGEEEDPNEGESSPASPPEVIPPV